MAYAYDLNQFRLYLQAACSDSVLTSSFLRELKAKGVTKQNAEKVQLKSKTREPGARSKKQEAAAMSSGEC